MKNMAIAFLLLLFCAPMFVQAAQTPGKQPLPPAMEQHVVMKPPAPVAGPSPSETIRAFYSSLVGMMKEGTNFDGRVAKLRAAFDNTYNMNDMTRLAVGPAWVKASPEQKDKLIQAFHDYSLATYANRFSKYDGEQFEVMGEKKGSHEGDVIVDTTLTSGTDKVQLTYLMQRSSQGWQIVDVYVNGAISELATRRSEFGSVVRTQGMDALFNLLQEKSKKLATES